MEIIYKALDELVPYENNPRFNDEAVDVVADSIEQFGFKVPIIVDADGVIIAGHTRLKASRQLGLKRVPVIYADDLTPEQAKAFRLADNKVSEFAEWDFEELEKELAEIAEIDMDAFGFGDMADTLDGMDDMYADGKAGSLTEDFIAPPFNVLDTRSASWLERKRHWRDLIGDNGESRDHVELLSIGTRLGTNMSEVSLLDPVLAEIINSWFTPNVVTPKTFDCFAGDTIFGYVSAYRGAEFTGIELRKEQADLNNARLAQDDLTGVYIQDDGQNVRQHIADGSQDLLFSCPPYYDLEVYSDLAEDASNQETYEEFYAIIDTALKESVQCLKDNRFAVIVAGDVRNKMDGGSYYGFPDDIKRTMVEAGLHYYNEITLINSFGTAPIRARNSMNNRKMVNVKQSVLVFYKGDLKQIQQHFSEIKTAEVEEDESGSI